MGINLKGAVIGGMIGSIFGPIGASIGAGIGAAIGEGENENTMNCPHCNTKLKIDKNTNIVICSDCQKPFFTNQSLQNELIVLAGLFAKMAKADGIIDKSEADFISDFIRNQLKLNEEDISFFKSKFKEFKDDDTHILYYVYLLNSTSLDDEMKYYIYQFLFQLALADNVLAPQEEELLKIIPSALGLNENLFYEMKDMFFGNNQQLYNEETAIQQAYEVFELEYNATFEEVKKAYRKKLNLYHPDKLGNVPEELKQLAQKEVQRLNEAYEILKKKYN